MFRTRRLNLARHVASVRLLPLPTCRRVDVPFRVTNLPSTPARRVVVVTVRSRCRSTVRLNARLLPNPDHSPWCVLLTRVCDSDIHMSPTTVHTTTLAT